jgi:hypothetical protein
VLSESDVVQMHGNVSFDLNPAMSYTPPTSVCLLTYHILGPFINFQLANTVVIPVSDTVDETL